MLKISSAGKSIAGQQFTNEDSFFMNGIFTAEESQSGAVYTDGTNRKIQMYAVFDGIGQDAQSGVTPNIKFQDGQSAAIIANETLTKLYRHIRACVKDHKYYNLNDSLYKYVQVTNNHLEQLALSRNARCGASFAALCFEANKVFAYNIGNCKVFLLRENRLNLLTINDTKVAQLVGAREMSMDVAQHVNENKILMQYLGLRPTEHVSELHINSRLTIQAGDKFLLCSDAICDALQLSRLLQIMSQDIAEEEITRLIISEASHTGIRENLTAVIVGINAPIDAEQKKAILKAMPNHENAQFKLAPFKSKFSFSPQLVKKLAFFGGFGVLFIVAIVFLFNGPLKFLGAGNPSDTTSSGLSSSSSITSVSNTTRERPTTSGYDIPPRELGEVDDPYATTIEGESESETVIDGESTSENNNGATANQTTTRANNNTTSTTTRPQQQTTTTQANNNNTTTTQAPAVVATTTTTIAEETTTTVETTTTTTVAETTTTTEEITTMTTTTTTTTQAPVTEPPPPPPPSEEITVPEEQTIAAE